MTNITRGAVTITPLLVDGYEATSESTTIVHQLVDGTIAVTLRPDRPRSGSLNMLFPDATTAKEAFDLHALGGMFELTDPDIAIVVNMSYVRVGAMSLRLDPESRRLWTLAVGYQEVLA